MKLSKDQLRETYFDGTVVNFRGDYHARTMTARAPENPRKANMEVSPEKGCGITTTSVILLGISPNLWWVSLWEALIVVSQKWSFPTALPLKDDFPLGKGPNVHFHVSLRTTIVHWHLQSNHSRVS